MKRILSSFLLLAIVTVLLGCNRKAAAPRNQPPKPPAVQLSEVETALMLAAFKGDSARVRELLDKGVNANIKDAEGRTPLTEAAWNGDPGTIKLLIERAADANAKKNDGETPLSIAIARGHKEAIDLLIKAGAK